MCGEKAFAVNSELPPDTLKHQFIFLRAPSNIQTVVRYDYIQNLYIFENRLGNETVSVSQTMTPSEYREHLRRESQLNYFRERNSLTAVRTDPPPRYRLPNRNQKKDPAESIFGPGGVRITSSGYVELSTGLKRNIINNPTLPHRARVRNRLDFDTDINLNLNAKVGDKIDFNIKYDSDATFNADARQVSLRYRGHEDDIIKNIEAGNVSMTTTNSLINSGAALFGIKADMQFGNLHLNTVFSQQKSESHTITTQGGIHTIPFEFSADSYDENRHFFLGYYFRDNYDVALQKLPFVQSRVSITRMEVWVTNRRSDYSQSRNIVAFTDIGEHNHISNPFWSASGVTAIPRNGANNMYEQLTTTYSGARNINEVDQHLPQEVRQGADYEKLENARLLSSSEYTYHPQLGYLSLRLPLQDDEVLAVAFEYTYNGEVHQVGEFTINPTGNGSSLGETGGTNPGGIGGPDPGENNGSVNGSMNIPTGSEALFVKLLKPVSLSPHSHTWHLMMKNIYSLGYNVYNVQKERFKMDITYRSDTTGMHLQYIPEGEIRNEQLLRVMNLDRLNGRNDPFPDGVFDFLEGFTVDSQNGFIIFPVVEPFGSHLKEKIGDDGIADKYAFQELYDSTLTVARQLPEKNKFRLSGEYRGSSGSDINLDMMNIARGSVRITAAGVELNEGTDYTVDYMMGTVTIINQSIIDAGTPLNITVENQPFMQSQRKTLMGINLLYDISKSLSVGGTLMHYYEKPLIMKTSYGDEASKNTLWGANLSFNKESYLITNLINKLPFVEATEPSWIRADLEYAQMIPGHYKSKYSDGHSYIDDFETSTSGIDISSPYAWSLASTPYNNSSSALFPEAALSNNTEYGKNRAQLAWFYIDGIFTRRNSGLTPTHIKNDTEQLSDHRVREVYEREIFPNREAYFGLPTTIPVLNLSYYPNERGPYNLDTNVDSEGRLINAGDRWGGITRRMDTRDFEAANIEYIEFWLMDPFVNDTLGTSVGGDLYFNLGDISEDVLKDGKKFFENGLPINGDTTEVGYTVWGKHPKRQSTVYAFDNSEGIEARRVQDVGLNGLSTTEELQFPTYSNYLGELQNRLSGATIEQMESDPHSPLNDPAGDNYRHYRGADLDRQQMSILDRYKYINGTEGNSTPPDEGSFAGVSKTTPDVEDINNDNTLNEHESYYQYRVQLKPEMMEVGTNFIVDKREVIVRLRNGSDGNVTWYQFKIPITQYESQVGNIRGFNNIRFMRMYLTGYEEPTFLRFATLQLVRSDWRSYNSNPDTGGPITGSGNLEISVVNIEENGSRTPINYIMPPGVNRIIDPGQPQLRQENEQSLSLKITDLEPGDTRSVYKNLGFDLRRYKRLQMFVHAEELPGDPMAPEDGDISLFIRVGTDYRNNFYEYEVPLTITPEGQYNSHSTLDREIVWPMKNMFNIPLQLFTSLKLERNASDEAISESHFKYSKNDPERPQNTISVMGNPSLAEVQVIMIGVRNRSSGNRSAEVWVNELRLTDFDEKGGWAAQGNINLALSDIGTVNVSGRKETAGFGALDQGLLQRRNDDLTSFNISLNMDLGRFLPKKAKVTAPFYYAFSDQRTTPLYNPFDSDILLSESLNNITNPLMRDSLQSMSLTKWTNKSVSLSNVNMDIKSSNPMPYDPANFRFTYSHNVSRQQDPETEYATVKDWRLQTEYLYTPTIKFLPNNIRFNSNIVRNYQEVQIRDISGNGFLTFNRNFFWDRNLSFSWNFTRNLRLTFRSGTLAEIEEPYLQVNRQINRSDYEIWNDTVMQSIVSLGRPLNYDQRTELIWDLPFTHVPALNWINSSASYNAGYRWERGAIIEDAEIGNILQNNLSLIMNSQFNFSSLYNKLFNRGSFVLKNINLNMAYRTRTDLPGYSPMIGDFFGQLNSPTGLQPGIAFAFGLDGGTHFVEESLNNNLLVINEENITPALYNETKNFRMEVALEPLKGLNINFNFLYEDNKRTEIQYMTPGMPTIRGGSFAVTTMSLFSNSETFNKFRNIAGTDLIPAFLQAYTGNDTPSMLPNWDLTYRFLNYTLSHRYTSQYRIGSYTSQIGPMEESMPYIIPSVSIIESFNPLIELQTLLDNNINLNLRINKSRYLNLNISSYQLIETTDNEYSVGAGYKLTNLNRIIRNDLSLRFDISNKTTRSLLRKIEDGYTQATSGIVTTSIRFSADYPMSRKLNLRAYYDKIIYRPMVSSSSYPTKNSSAGISLRLNL